MIPFSFDPQANEELLAASARYERRRAGLGQEFIDNVQLAVDAATQHPDRYFVIHRFEQPPREIRRILVERFRYYSVVYMHLPDEVRILAVAHARRRPGYWKKRVPDF